MKIKSSVSLLLVYAIWLNLFAPFIASPSYAQTISPQNNNQTEQPEGLQFRIREDSSPTIVSHEIPKLPAAQNLTEQESNAILRRLPALKSQQTDKSDFALRSNSLPPPKTGNIIPTKFPADEQQTAPNVNDSNSATALEVVRFSPEGDVPLVSDLSVTFSQPMIAVASQSEAAENVPVKLTPNVKGRWRWLGTKTLVFDAETRFPMATKFVATIPAGTKSAVGSGLLKEISWTFSTPPPTPLNFSLNGQQIESVAVSSAGKPETGLQKSDLSETFRRDALMLAIFDQAINAEAVLPKINAASNNQKIQLRLASQEEIAANENILKTIKDLQTNRFIVFRSIDLLPADSKIIVTFESDLPSAEGILTSAAPRNYMFKTFSGLTFDKAYCNYDDGKDCQSYKDWQIRFNNRLDEKTFDKSQVRVAPSIGNPKISVSDNEISVEGDKKSLTNYKVTIAKSLRDEFGQTLEKDVSINFKIGAEEAGLYDESRDKNVIVLDPNAKPTFSIYSINYESLKVKIYSVKPEDYLSFRALRAEETAKLPTFGKLVLDKSVNIKSEPGEQIETRINLSPALQNNIGHAVLIVEPPVVNKENEHEKIIKWFEATQIGIDAFADSEQLSVFVSDLKNGKPLSNAQVSLFDGASSTTDESGIATLRLPSTSENKINFLIVRRETDTAILSENYHYGEYSDWTRKPQNDSLRWFVFNDRNMYRPGEAVSIKGYIRKVTGGKFAEINELGDAATNLNYVLKDSRGNEVLRGNANFNLFGAFNFQFALPENLNLGYQRLEFATNSNLENKTLIHNFQVQEFRRPEFEVSANVEASAPFYVADSAVVNVEAKYYAGGALSNAETNWNVTAEPTNYTPPNRHDFTFGKFIAWWRNSYENDYGQTTSQVFKGVTGADGKHLVAVDFVGVSPARPFTLSANARVQDVNRQTFAAATSLLIHPSELYVGIKTQKTFVNANDSLKVETITTDIDGKAVEGAPVLISAKLKDWQQVRGEWQQVTVDTQTCQVKSTNDVVSCSFTAQASGNLTVTASVWDVKKRRNESALEVWVAGGKTEPARDVEQEKVNLIPDKKDYAPSDVAEILVNSPFVPAEGVLTLRRNGILKTERFTMNESATVLRVPLEERYLPNIHVQVDLVGATERVVYDDERDAKLPKRPAFASGELNLNISTASRRLSVTAEPVLKTLEPGGSTTINVSVKDNKGNAVPNSEVAIVAVDESVLALTNYKISNPLDSFYPEISKGVGDYHSRENVLLANPEDLQVGFGRGNGIGYGNASLEVSSPQLVRLRADFNALAIFAPSVVTDASGKAVVSLNLPDNLTRYRITAVAVTNSKQFGLGESAITAKQPLIIRPSAPRFMNFSDKIELPVVVQNQTDNPLTVNVAMRATNASLSNGNGRKITIAANDRAEIRFPVAADRAGTARFQIGAVSGKFADAAEIELPVYAPATTEAFATYGTTDQGGVIVQPITQPNDVFAQFGGLEVTTSSTQLQELTDAFIYLQNYPFECSEQIASRVLSVTALRDVLTAFDAKDLPSPNEIKAKMQSDLERLQKLQHADGGFSFWRSDDTSVPFVSVHVAHALARAKAKGYAASPETINKAKKYLGSIESKFPTSYSPESRAAIESYALYVRNLLGDNDAAKARKLLQTATLEKLSLESVGWILAVLAKEESAVAEVEILKRHLANRATETAGAAHFTTNYVDGKYVLLASERRADAVILESLLLAEPNNDLVPKIVRGLLANKIKGRWLNTQENAFVLLALDKYFNVFEKQTPNFTTQIWLGDDYAGEQKFTGRSLDSNLTVVPMDYLQQNSNLILNRQGDGRLYYRIGLNYALKNLKLNAADFGFAVTRNYEAIDEASDVRQNADRSWTIKSGARVRVRLQMVAPTRRYHVALVDKLPAGFEIINSSLAIAEFVPSEKSDDAPNSRGYYFNRNWFEHQNLRDERSEAFTTILPAGVWNYSYVARATTPGTFVAPPAKAEEMYQPETFGRSQSDFVRIE